MAVVGNQIVNILSYYCCPECQRPVDSIQNRVQLTRLVAVEQSSSSTGKYQTIKVYPDSIDQKTTVWL